MVVPLQARRAGWLHPARPISSAIDEKARREATPLGRWVGTSRGVTRNNHPRRLTDSLQSLGAAMSLHLVTKLHHAALVGFDLRQMEGDVSVELFEERDPVTNQDGQDRIANFVG